MTFTVQQKDGSNPYAPATGVPIYRPAELSGCLQTFTESALENTIRSQSDNNAIIKVRRRTTAAVRIADASVTVPESEVELWKDWFYVRCQSGVLPTYFMTPYGTEEIWRFAAPLSIAWGQGQSPGNHVATITMKLEQLPAWRQ